MDETDRPPDADAESTLDPMDEAVWERWHEQQLKAAGDRIRASIRDMQDKGILDENGDPVNKDLPLDMLAGDKPSDIV